jgi:hypothetical protein
MGDPMPVPSSIDELSTAPANNYPGGSEQVFPNLDDYLRFHAACLAQLRDEIKVAGTPLGSVSWWGGARSAITLPRVPMDGQSLNRADYPELWGFVSAGGYPVTTDAAWLASPLSRGSFSSGNGSTTFRMPDLNGIQPGSINSVYLRGDGVGSAGAAGLLQDSQNLAHSHAATTSQTGAHTHPISGTTSSAGLHTHTLVFNHNQYDHGITGSVGDNGLLNPTRTQGSMSSDGEHTHQISGSANSAGTHNHSVAVESSGGTETRGAVATGCHVMRVR